MGWWVVGDGDNTENNKRNFPNWLVFQWIFRFCFLLFKPGNCRSFTCLYPIHPHQSTPSQPNSILYLYPLICCWGGYQILFPPTVVFFPLTAASIVSIWIVNLLNCYALGLFLLGSKQTIDGVENGVPIERMPVAEGHELCVYSSNSFSIHHINWIINNNSNLGIDSFIVRMCPQWLRVRICNRI